MGKEHTAKSFKSGNSIAIRIPAALGIEPDSEWSVEEKDGDLILHRKHKPKRKFNVEKVWGIGSHLDLKPLRPEDRVFEERKLLWDDPEWQAGRNSAGDGDKA